MPLLHEKNAAWFPVNEHFSRAREGKCDEIISPATNTQFVETGPRQNISLILANNLVAQVCRVLEKNMDVLNKKKKKNVNLRMLYRSCIKKNAVDSQQNFSHLDF